MSRIMRHCPGSMIQKHTTNMSLRKGLFPVLCFRGKCTIPYAVPWIAFPLLYKYPIQASDRGSRFAKNKLQVLGTYVMYTGKMMTL